MPGKYSNLKDSLTRFTAEPEYQQRVNQKKEEIRKELIDQDYPLSPTSYGRILVTARMEKNRLEELVRAQNLIIEAMSQELVDYMESADMVSVKMSDGISIGIKDDVYVAVEDKETFHSWIRENHLEDLFSVHYQTMASMTKERLLNGDDVPPGLKPYFKQSVIVRGVKQLESTV